MNAKNCPCCGQYIAEGYNDEGLVLYPGLMTFSFNGLDLGMAPMEYKCMKLLYDKIGEPVTRQTFFDEIIGYEYDGETRTIDAAIVRLRKRLERTRHEIKTIRAVGYMLVKNELNQIVDN